MNEDPRLLLLDDQDDIMVVIAPIRRGETMEVDGLRVQATADIGLGHKVARRPLAPGAQVHKYGVPIGSVTKPIAVGEHVHVHNLASNYTPTYTLDDAKPSTGGT
ncbi:MAG TPA: UxaA family hydrolase [Geminicoccus sp.]|jgi:hypothetical protein|uniref:UxaA family hydrolase n=1 Tax=Geminicoccus sp. TaxID=2024832 RepID=UPI002E307D6B|nr:UxaA family hydrolase [Geminicoccus sp.]HEX2529704.1 UxaA family hydrolase [Geminicoccus sp.]